MAHKPLPSFSPPRNAQCLCGSGLKYKHCCADRLPGDVLGSKTRAFLKEGKFKEALLASRADMTQYTIWHKSHTEPAVRMGMQKEGSLLEIDIRAMASIIDNLLLCHVKTNTMDEFPAALERLRSNINDQEWQRKITYFHAVHALWPKWDEAAGRRELKKLGSIANDKDEEILQLYLDLFGDDLTFSEKQDLIERILAISERFRDRLHYRGSKAVLYWTVGDKQKAEKELEEVIAEARIKQSEEGLTEYEQYRFALTLDMLGSLRKDKDLLDEALGLYQNFLKDDQLSPKELAHILVLMGQTYGHKFAWEEARQTYERVLEIEPLSIHKIFLTECLIQLNETRKAMEILDDIKLNDLSAAERADYAFIMAAVAIETNEKERLESAKIALKNISVRDPIFRERRDFLLLNIQEALISGVSPTLIQRTRRLIADMARSVTSYLILKPSFMGIGVDIGKIIEDLSGQGSQKIEKTHVKPGSPEK